MNITLFAVGTRGDVQPLIALGRGLKDAGHSVRVATTFEFERLAVEQDLECFSLSGSPSELMATEAMQTAMDGNASPVRIMWGIWKSLGPLIETGVQEAWESARGADVIVASMAGFYAACHAAEKEGIPCIEGNVLPSRPTREHPTILGAVPSLGGWANYHSQVVLQRLSGKLFEPLVNRARRQVLDLPKIRFHRVFADIDARRQPVLNGYSSLISPKPADWPDWYHVTGWWFLETAGTWQPPAALLHFLEAGPPPVYIGFGSMVSRQPEETARIALEALRRTGQRGLLLTGWGGIQKLDVSDEVYVIESAPHDWLFPRMGAVVHHGGSGTTAAGLRAGVPSVLVPHSGDQFFWGRCVHQAGAGPAPIFRKKLSADRLARAIDQAVSTPAFIEQVAAIGEKIRAENGVARAVEIIESALP